MYVKVFLSVTGVEALFSDDVYFGIFVFFIDLRKCTFCDGLSDNPLEYVKESFEFMK